jgi:hypothetical protein
MKVIFRPAPVLLLIYRRPDLSRRLIESVAAARPRELFISADGPRGPDEAALCEAARAAVLDRIDWPCNVRTRFSMENQGPRYGPSRAIDWVFSEVDEAIILEDDCIPGPSFFSFCADLLERYCNDDRIMEIGGANYQFGRRRSDASYYFSAYAHTHGWATWRRAWHGFDPEIRDWPRHRDAGILDAWLQSPLERHYWTGVFDSVHAGTMLTSWDYQWMLHRWSRWGLTAVSENNLVSNLGFGPEATHTRRRVAFSELPITEIDEIRHPDAIYLNRAADAFMFEHTFGGRFMRWPWRSLRAIARRARSALGR